MTNRTRANEDATQAMLARLRDRTQQMTDELAALVACESPSVDADATRRCADLAENWLRELLHIGPATRHEVRGHTHLTWQFGDVPQVVLLGHLDTVWPLGTLQRWPFSVTDGHATGPGVFDMKAGLVQLAHALSVIDDLTGVAILLTTDEEVGSPTSHELIQATARGARAALVLEPSVDGKLKTARKGGSMYDLRVSGRAAHAGLEPERGANAGISLALAIPDITGLANPNAGTTVTPTVMSAGTTGNTVPDTAVLHIDVRAFDVAEQERVDQSLRALRPRVTGTSFTWEGGINRPPLPNEASQDLFHLAAQEAQSLGLQMLEGARVGGGSDGNFTVAVGVPTLDGLGAVGAGAHAEGEFVSVAHMPERAALLARLLQRLGVA